MVKIVLAGLVIASLTLTVVSLARAFNCPVVIKQAEDMIHKAEGKTNAETKPLLDDAKRYLAEAKAHHANAKVKRDHGDAVRKAKFAAALAEEAIVLQSP